MVPEVPQTVINQIKRQIATLEALTIARRTDASFNGQGRYEAEAYLNRKDEIETAWKLIDEFEAQCAKQLIDPATVYAEVGQPAQLSDAAKEWVADFSRDASIEGKTVIYDGRGVYPAASFIGVLRDDDPQKPYLAITIHSSRRFKTESGARKFYDKQMRSGFGSPGEPHPGRP